MNKWDDQRNREQSITGGIIATMTIGTLFFLLAGTLTSCGWSERYYAKAEVVAVTRGNGFFDAGWHVIVQTADGVKHRDDVRDMVVVGEELCFIFFGDWSFAISMNQGSCNE